MNILQKKETWSRTIKLMILRKNIFNMKKRPEFPAFLRIAKISFATNNMIGLVLDVFARIKYLYFSLMYAAPRMSAAPIISTIPIGSCRSSAERMIARTGSI